MITDAIVVGSGPGGVNAAARLVEMGRRVLLLDYGARDERYAGVVPARAFVELRRTDAGQWRYFLGERYEGVPLGAARVGAQLTPPRMYVLRDAERWIPVAGDGIAAAVSLGQGGLGAAWSAGVFPFSDDELQTMGSSLDGLRPHYDAVVARIGVAGARDDLDRFFPSSPALLPPLEPDTNGATVLARYERRRTELNAGGFFLGRPRVAACTRRFRGRGPHRYLDMDYFSDADRSVYRPQWTLAELRSAARFQYLDGRLVYRFEETVGGVRVRARDVRGGADEVHEARALVLAAGTLGSAWIVLRSLGRYGAPVPLVTNPYGYVVTLNTNMLGRAPRDARYSMGQLTAVVRMPGSGRLVQAQLFSYRSLLTFKLLKESPLGHGVSLRILRRLLPYVAILGLHHADEPTPRKTCELRPGGSGPDALHLFYRLSSAEERAIAVERRRVLRFFRRLGCVPLRRVVLPPGSSFHFAGTFPIRASGGPLTCDRHGRLRPLHRVYLADGSVFPWLPAKGLTFNIMANADRVGAFVGAQLC